MKKAFRAVRIEDEKCGDKKYLRHEACRDDKVDERTTEQEAVS